MTPEERFTKIENAIQAITETQARHEIEKQNAGIRDLITVSRTLLDSQQGLLASHQEMRNTLQELAAFQKQTTAEIHELREAPKYTDEKLNALIDVVNRIIERRGNGQN
ncbi:MAG: hypothetical protein HYU27_10120 [Acidobacteria bacterium]|nr:hypothetical protein [Acidobacteriota bacterium]